jgi:iron complex transport system ATP-binding protein
MVLRVEAIVFGYPGRCLLLHDVSFTVGSGDIFCLLGPNGAGKTTLLRCILGVQRMQGGHILIAGREVHTLTARELARHIAYVPQVANPSVPFSVTEMVLMGRTPYVRALAVPTHADLEMALWALDKVGIGHLAPRLYTEISGGERQLVLIARALAQQACLLLLDEPTANLDLGNQIKVLQVIRELAEQGYAVLMTSHLPDHAFLLRSRVALLAQGQIAVSGWPEEVVTDAVLSQLYNTRIRVAEVAVPEAGNAVVHVCIPLMDVNASGRKVL